MSDSIVQSSIKVQPLRRRPFYHRFLRALGLSAGLVGFSLGLGILGRHLHHRHGDSARAHVSPGAPPFSH